jgi:hypothetical protein
MAAALILCSTVFAQSALPIHSKRDLAAAMTASPGSFDVEAGGYYPHRALRMNVKGEAVLDCRFGPGLVPEDCSVVAENPLEWGFGTAALMIVHRHAISLRPKATGPAPAQGQRVRLNVQFR